MRLCGECGLERQPVEHIEGEGAVGIDVLPFERGESPEVDGGEPPLPLFLFEHLLNHEGVDVDEAGLQQMQRQHQCHAALKSRKMHYEAKILHSNRGIQGAFVLKSRTERMGADAA